MSTTKFNVPKEDIETYQQGLKAFLSKHKVKAEAFSDMHDLVLQRVTSNLDKLDMFIACEGKPGEVYNRKTGEVYKIEKLGKIVNKEDRCQTDPVKSIGSFRKAKNTAKPQQVAGAVGRFR